MKSAIIVGAGQDLAAWAAFAAAEGIDGIELMFWDPKPEDLQHAAEAKRILDDHGVAAAAVGVWGYGLSDPTASGSAAVLRQAIDFAGGVGAHCFFTGAGDADGDDPAGTLGQMYPAWTELAEQAGVQLAVYLGHKGSFIASEKLLAEACRQAPGLGLKLDPIGIIRNVKADPYEVLFRFGANLTHFHVKDRLILKDAELEPPPGLGELAWGRMFAILHQHAYDSYVSVEPHGACWTANDEQLKRYIRLTLAHLQPFF